VFEPLQQSYPVSSCGFSRVRRYSRSLQVFSVGSFISIRYAVLIKPADGQRLWDSFRVDLRSAISLGLVARLAYPTTLLVDAPFGIEPSLAVIVGHALGYSLLKDQQMLAWDAASLSDEQKDCKTLIFMLRHRLTNTPRCGN
jgi:hypothetical protein